MYDSCLDGTVNGTATYTTSFTGYGAAISFNQSSYQYVSIASGVLPLNCRSFTIEAWIYPISLLTSSDYGIIGQCQALTNFECFHFIIRGNKLYCGFFGSDVAGGTSVKMNEWCHVACVYDFATQAQQVWLNGYVDGSHICSPYNGSQGQTTIGASFHSSTHAIFNGYIDNVRYEARAKNSTEILNDASLSVYHSFDGGSLNDSGPNDINGTVSGSLPITSGRVNQALQFASGSYMYYQYPPFYFIGIDGYPFTKALWVKPNGTNTTQTLVFLKTTSGWCVHTLVMTSNRQLAANFWTGSSISTNGSIISLNTWTHIGYTYSTSNGIRLYINGVQYSTTGPFMSNTHSMPMSIILGGDAGHTVCSPGYGGAFTGAIDEFYVYRRELNATEIWALANP
ncbi:unnamed protein product [Rotaria magnacalcarata]|nr:unnamed protein product [Rotaria magnacalcarata]CAF2079574.1 unnamed protein product [Rotaria magnacalcarata]CAF2122903.1 unnamed protein product [Rotaria magnacalcarata]CAF3889753.1 unnamed protein product [Rotaria magnacalcarata]CAF3966966.1 unnamed protein product [Rotaria magnacalcarata]